jgi:SAM-dependent methyltransferase
VSLDPALFWNRNSALFAATVRNPQSFYARRTALVAELVSRRADGRRALDIGCGAGQLCLELARRGFDVHGADVSGPLIAAAVEGAGDFVEAPEQRFRICEPDALPFEGRFDVITAIGVLPYVANHGIFIARAMSRLVPGGLFLASCTNRKSLFTLVALARHARSFEPSGAWFAVLVNLVRTGVWSGGFVDPHAARQCRSAGALDRLCRRLGLALEDSVDLYNVRYGGLDSSPLERGRLDRTFARHFGWTHVGVYRVGDYARAAED